MCVGLHFFDDLRRETPAGRGQQRVERDPFERIGRERPERLLGSGGAGDRTARGLQPLVHHARRVLERLALEQPGQQEVALFEAHQLLVEIDVFAAGQQPAGLQLDERRRDEQELGGDVEVDPFHALDLGAEHVDDVRERDLPEVDLFFQDEVQEEVERAFENGRRDLVRHGVRLPAPNHRHVVQRSHLANVPRPRWSRDGPTGRPVTWPPMARVFSGIKPTGDMHLGNYLGAVRRWVDTQPPAGSERPATTTRSSASSTSTR